MLLKKWIADIKEKTADMDKKETCSYIAEYYWPHILGAFSAVALILLFDGHYLTGNKKPAFTCVIVNQMTDAERDQRAAAAFAGMAGIPEAAERQCWEKTVLWKPYWGKRGA